MIPFRRRGMYQALQNSIFGFGAISGASFGGTIADHIGWRWCFLSQVPISILALAVGYLVVKNQPLASSLDNSLGSVWKRVDVLGSLLLVTAVSVQLVGLSLGGNELPWGSPGVIGSLLGSLVLFALFLWVEANTTAIPVIPLRLLKGRLPVATQLANVCAGMTAYGVSSLPTFPSMVSNKSLVSLHASSLLPSGIARLCYNGWSAPCNSFPGYTDRWSYRRYCHVSLGQTHTPRSNWGYLDDFWKCFGHVAWI